MPQNHTLPATHREAKPTSGRPTPKPTPSPPPFTTTLLRFFAGVWIVVGCVASLATMFVAFVVVTGGAKPADRPLETFAAVFAVALTTWTVGVVLSWMANIADDMRSAMAK